MTKETDDQRAERILGPLMRAELRAAEIVAQALNAALCPETMFKLAPTPDLMSDTGIHRLELWKGGPKLPRRAFDLHTEYTSYAPVEQRWTCIDLNTYDGAPDSEAPATFIGRGMTEHAAKMDLIEQFRDFDGEPMQKASRPIHSSPFEPTEYADEPRRDPDEE
jgi:hypothetical protein